MEGIGRGRRRHSVHTAACTTGVKLRRFDRNCRETAPGAFLPVSTALNILCIVPVGLLVDLQQGYDDRLAEEGSRSTRRDPTQVRGQTFSSARSSVASTPGLGSRR